MHTQLRTPSPANVAPSAQARSLSGRAAVVALAAAALLGAAAAGSSGVAAAGSRPIAAGTAAAAVPAVTVVATYHGDLARTGFDASDTAINVANASSLTASWHDRGGGLITSQPIVAGGRVYWSDWAGDEHASSLSGKVLWSTFLGQTVPRVGFGCTQLPIGVASTATVGTIGQRQVLWVGTGDGRVDALDARTGAIVWSTKLAAPPDNFVWSSPAVDDGNLYIGSSSLGDCPLTPGRLWMLDAATGRHEHVLSLVPKGCVGAGVWSSPTIDAAAGTIYFTTGNPQCDMPAPLGFAIVEVRLDDVARIVGHWTIPPSQRHGDADFGATPTLFTAELGKTTEQLVGAAGKNGTFYAFDRDHLGAGPIWRYQIAIGGGSPQNGGGSISPAAFDGTSLYLAGGHVVIKGAKCAGSIVALDPATGEARWRDCLHSGPVLGALTAVPGLVFADDGSDVTTIGSRRGKVLDTYHEASDQAFWGPVEVAGGVAYAGNNDGTLVALAPSR